MGRRTFEGGFVLSVGAACLSSAVVGCAVRELDPPAVTYAEVEPVLTAKCLGCHGPDRVEGGYRVDTYVAAISCPTDAGSAVALPAATSPIVTAQGTPAHVGLLTATETALVTRWVADGADATVGAMHVAGWADPRSAEFHGKALLAERFARMFQPPTEPGACARCHAGAPGATEPLAFPAPRATACTTCHREEGGPTACTTCHGSPGKAFPPRDPCLHPDEALSAGAHETHVVKAGFACTLCHEERTVAQLRDLTSQHGDGVVQVVFDRARAGADASFDEGAGRGTGTGTCSMTYCHNRPGGTLTTPTWAVGTPLMCNSCHSAPPPDHYLGTCNTCHSEANADGTARIPGPLHMNGKVDVGNGALVPGTEVAACNACHGGSDPTGMPATGSHASHVHSTLTADLACSNCHVMPPVPRDLTHPSRTRSTAQVQLSGLAAARGAVPVYDVDAGTCSQVACHGNGAGVWTATGLSGGTFKTPTWGATNGLAARCGACHAVPPPAPHTPSRSCNSVACHGGEIAAGVDGPVVTDAGRALHVNGVVNLWPTP